VLGLRFSVPKGLKRFVCHWAFAAVFWWQAKLFRRLGYACVGITLFGTQRTEKICLPLGFWWQAKLFRRLGYACVGITLFGTHGTEKICLPLGFWWQVRLDQNLVPQLAIEIFQVATQLVDGRLHLLAEVGQLLP
jgi:hypothetical protein